MGTSIGPIQVMMGHESQNTTMGYVVTRPADLAQVQVKCPALIEGRVSRGLA
jgi:integrase